ncbi:hypothetical protein CDD83_10783 [Cordyceps sp. RAO-2017]|nr:hypothetical protein CDD83_10783 [Cordyceps sp. RAO-2017]
MDRDHGGGSAAVRSDLHRAPASIVVIIEKAAFALSRALAARPSALLEPLRWLKARSASPTSLSSSRLHWQPDATSRPAVAP